LVLQFFLGLSNAFLLRGDRAALVDTGRPRDVGALVRALRGAGVDPEQLSLILHSHGHWDHAGGTRELKRRTGVPVAVHRRDADLLRRGTNGVLRPTGPMGALLKPFLDRPFPPVEPDLLLDGEADLRPFGVPARVVATPGHTAGSVTVLTEDGEAIVGDLLIGGYAGGRLLPRRPTLHYFAEDLPTLRASIRALLRYGPSRVFVGHGGPLDAEAIRRRFVGPVG
jgi:hydroxyacylglutathione hydrolase